MIIYGLAFLSRALFIMVSKMNFNEKGIYEQEKSSSGVPVFQVAKIYA